MRAIRYACAVSGSWWFSTILAVVVFGTSIVYWWRLPDEQRGRPSWARVAMAGLLLFGLVLPAYYGLTESLEGLRGEWNSTSSKLLIAGSILLFTLLGAIVVQTARGRWLAKLPRWQFLCLYLGVSLISRLAYLLAMDVRPVSDFESMWRFANEWAAYGFEPGRTVLSGRAIPFLFPLASLFGPEREVYELGNLAAFGLCAYLVYRLAVRYAGENLARASVLLLVFCPETYFALAIPSHDVTGAALFLGAVALGHWAYDLTVCKRLRSAAMVAVLVGVVWLLLEVQRGNTVVLFLGTAIWWLVFSWPERKTQTDSPRLGSVRLPSLRQLGHHLLTGLVVVGIPFVIWKGAHGQMFRSEVLRSQPRMQGRWYAANTDSWAGGSYTYARENYYKYYQKISLREGGGPSMWRRLAVSKITGDLHYNTDQWGGYFKRKAKRLFNLGSQTGFYISKKHVTKESTIRSQKALSSLRKYSRVFTASFLLFLMSCAALAAAYVRWRTELSVPVLTLLIQSLGLLLLGEVQSRYLYMLWFIGPLLLAGTLAELAECRRKASCLEALKPNRRVGLKLAASASLLLLLANTLLYAAASSTKRALDFREWSDVSATYYVFPDFIESVQSEQRPKRPFQLVLRHYGATEPKDEIAVSNTYRVDSTGPHVFSVLLRGERFGKLEKPELEAQVRVQGKVIRRFPVARTMKSRAIEISGIEPIDGSIELELALVSLARVPASTARTTKAYFEYATLTPE